MRVDDTKAKVDSKAMESLMSPKVELERVGRLTCDVCKTAKLRVIFKPHDSVQYGTAKLVRQAVREGWRVQPGNCDLAATVRCPRCSRDSTDAGRWVR